MKRAAFSAFVTGAALVSPRRAIAEPDLPALRIGLVPSENFALALFVHEQGFFKTLKANVEISSFPTSAIANAHGRGFPRRVVAPGGMYTSASPTIMLTVARTSTIKTAKELNGKTIAGHLDAAAILEPSLSEALRTSVRAFAKPLNAVCTPQMASADYASTTSLDKNAAVVKSFVATMKLAAAWANANHAATATILARHSKLTVIKSNKRIAPPTPTHSIRRRCSRFSTPMGAYKVLANRFPVQQTFWSPVA